MRDARCEATGRSQWQNCSRRIACFGSSCSDGSYSGDDFNQEEGHAVVLTLVALTDAPVPAPTSRAQPESRDPFHRAPAMRLGSAILLLYSFLPFLLVLLLGCQLLLPRVAAETPSPRVVTTKYGKLRGVIRSLNNKHLRPVEVFLGVPYATPPTGSNRFSPTRTPHPWSGERMASQYGPVCPQQVPAYLWNDTAALTYMPKSHLEHLRRLANYLTHQAEDCLYLNIYVPSLVSHSFVPKVADTAGHKALPVVIYIHGESFEWGASNPYDGSVLAAFGEVIVVTLNYRLGALGFLNTNTDPGSRGHVMNYGLMDQIAALHWVQENIGAFGGDPGSVTLLGHGTGAACIHFLMSSTAVVPGLFQRAILMSGSALSSWATVGTPTFYALQFGRALNCTTNFPIEVEDFVPSDQQFDQMVNCLKEKPLEELQSVTVKAPQFLYAFGPSVDGIVIKQDYDRELRKKVDEFSKEYDLLFGVVPQESYNSLSEKDVKEGFNTEKRNRIFRTLVRNIYDYHLNEVYISLVNEYTDWEKPMSHPGSTRDATLKALGDARYVAPLLRTAHNLRIGDKTQFFYVFDYDQHLPKELQGEGTLHGEELPFVFGAPLVGELGIFGGNWTRQDQVIAEAVLTYFTNFAKTGNPNPRRDQDVNAVTKEKSRYRALQWDQFDPVYQKYLEIGERPRMRDHYRAHKLSLWTWLIPQLQRVGRLEFLTLRDPEDPVEDDPESAQERLQELSVLHHLFHAHDDPLLYWGDVRPLNHMAGHYIIPSTTTTPVPPTTTTPSILGRVLTTNRTFRRPSAPERPFTNLTVQAEASHPEGAMDYVAYSTALSVTIAIGVSLLILNVLIFAGVYYQRDRSRMGDKSEQQSPKLTLQSMSDQQLGQMSHASGPILGSSITLESTKPPHSSVSALKAPPPSPLGQTQAFTHISECPPAFADNPLGFPAIETKESFPITGGLVEGIGRPGGLLEGVKGGEVVRGGSPAGENVGGGCGGSLRGVGGEVGGGFGGGGGGGSGCGGVGGGGGGGGGAGGGGGIIGTGGVGGVGGGGGVVLSSSNELVQGGRSTNGSSSNSLCSPQSPDVHAHVVDYYGGTFYDTQTLTTSFSMAKAAGEAGDPIWATGSNPAHSMAYLTWPRKARQQHQQQQQQQQQGTGWPEGFTQAFRN
ncbi:neuroligin-3-like [Oratosquilla oratoria]|uniref:neuroligin-3-like n=1 Tax=Oratosquilla oratoria TaxID=337810 RepID=UPI003F7703AC